MAKRRLNGEGTIYWHKGLKRYMIQVVDAGIRRTFYATTQADAKKKLRGLQRKQDQGERLVTSGMPLKDYLDVWIESIKNRVRPSTFQGHETMVRVHLVPRLGHIRLNKLMPEHITRAWDKMIKDGKSASVVEHCHVRLSKALNDAVKRDLIYRNPCQVVAPPKAQAKEKRLLDLEEINNLLAVAGDTEYYGIIHTALHTGLRRNELLALRWKDIDMDEAVIFLSRSLFRDKGGVTLYHPPKTAKGRRSVDLTPSSAILLRQLRQQQELDGLLYGYEVNEESSVFRYRTGTPMLPDAVSHAFKRIAERVGLHGYHFHNNRDTHATLLLRQGVHPKVVQERLGHAKVGTTMDIYSHVMPTLQKEAADRFDLALESAV
jgi:integrase